MSRRSKPERRIPSADPIYNSVDVSKFTTNNVKDMSYMFQGCRTLKYLDIQ